MESVVIVGTGLIGSSFGLAIKASGFRGRVTGVSSPESLQAALERGAIDQGGTLEELVPQADLVYLSQPIGKILDVIAKLAGLLRPGALVTDAGSTKRRIMAAAVENLPAGAFLGGHPMAGKEARGAAAAEADLFADRPYFLTPLDPGDLTGSHVPELLALVGRIGARPVIISAAEHDRLVAATSHLPQVVSTVLAGILTRQPGSERLAESGGPGLADMTRLALSSYEVWRDILATNRDEIDRMLEQMELGIAGFRRSIDAAEGTFKTARAFAARVPRRTV